MATRPENKPWWDEFNLLKDEMSLVALAKRFDTTPGALTSAMKRKGIVRRRGAIADKLEAEAAAELKNKAPRQTRRIVRPEPKAAKSTPKAPPAKKSARAKKSAPAKEKAPANKKAPTPKSSASSKKENTRSGYKDNLIKPFSPLLGKMADLAVAKKVGVSPATIRSYRERHGIEAFVRSAVPSPESAPKKRKPKSSKIDPFRELVGRLSDKEVAKRAGVTPQSVYLYRRKNNISAASKSKPAAAPPAQPATTNAPRGSKVAAFHDIVGTLPDGEVAKRAGVSAQTVLAYRRRNGIAAAPRSARKRAGRKPSQTVAAAPTPPKQEKALAAAAPGSAYGWLVELEGRDDHVVVAGTTAEVVGRTVTARGGKVLSMKRIGDFFPS